MLFNPLHAPYINWKWFDIGVCICLNWIILDIFHFGIITLTNKHSLRTLLSCPTTKHIYSKLFEGISMPSYCKFCTVFQCLTLLHRAHFNLVIIRMTSGFMLLTHDILWMQKISNYFLICTSIYYTFSCQYLTNLHCTFHLGSIPVLLWHPLKSP